MTNENVETPMLRAILDAIPALIFVVDDDVRIVEYNAVAAEFLSMPREAVISHRGGHVLHCIHADAVPQGCGRGPACEHCVIRNSVREAFQGGQAVRRRSKIEIKRGVGEKLEVYALITASSFVHDGRKHVLLVIEDISEIAELRRLVPICSVCRKVRDEKEAWLQVERYFKEHWDLDFSHGYCPECFENQMRKLNEEVERGK